MLVLFFFIDEWLWNWGFRLSEIVILACRLLESIYQLSKYHNVTNPNDTLFCLGSFEKHDSCESTSKTLPFISLSFSERHIAVGSIFKLYLQDSSESPISLAHHTLFIYFFMLVHLFDFPIDSLKVYDPPFNNKITFRHATQFLSLFSYLPVRWCLILLMIRFIFLLQQHSMKRAETRLAYTHTQLNRNFRFFFSFEFIFSFYFGVGHQKFGSYGYIVCLCFAVVRANVCMDVCAWFFFAYSFLYAVFCWFSPEKNIHYVTDE